jgi:integrase
VQPVNKEMATWQMRLSFTRYKVITAGPPFLSEREAFTSSLSLSPSLGWRARFLSNALQGLPKIRFHDLRHTCATLLLSKNVNPKIVSEILGHATIAITLDTYSHVLPTMQESAAKAMEDALS